MSHTQEQAVKNWLGTFVRELASTRHGAERMRAATERFVKHRDIPPRQMWYVTCDADGGSRGNEHWRWIVETSLDEQGRWVANGVSGGSGPVPRRGRPWADLGGNWGPAGFRAGGTVEDAGTGIARVRLTDVEGHSFEDAVENGVVLFSSDRPVAMPMRLELIDREGSVVETDEWGFVDE